ncbi:response regulator [Dyadobacter bucti]|uniref:response regulator n=1 Tax=Dyadobacter bucti TaxID=2572203 RepID=UPI0011092CBF|nr:response regulator transcription factor [Dyadobacter bucti]|eukprot:Unigene13373_Nuclearia_a/m.40535 Unigene13373_Nuclearia_a/g.40535  ORF Unigene13373_Nuclearia_a/g.40535 Unigene13373_Nuclearia_a/m.40535 type:complete len:131 (+) Unigene13373_Nuclearia_a:420-812(+)
MDLSDKILLIDDDDDDRFLIGEAFKLTGFDIQITEATTGNDGIEMIRSLKPLPSLIVVDMNMPGMGGIETIQQIRLLQSTVPVVLLTTSLTSQLANDAINQGANGSFNKPIQFEDMCSLAHQLCRRFLQN